MCEVPCSRAARGCDGANVRPSTLPCCLTRDGLLRNLGVSVLLCSLWHKHQINGELKPLSSSLEEITNNFSFSAVIKAGSEKHNSKMFIQLLNLTALLHKFQHPSVIYPIIKKKSNYVLIIFDTVLLLVVINWKSLHHFMLNSKMNDIFQLLACLMLLNCFRKKGYS